MMQILTGKPRDNMVVSVVTTTPGDVFIANAVGASAFQLMDGLCEGDR